MVSDIRRPTRRGSTASLHATSTHQELCDGDTSTRRTMRCEQHCSEMVTKALPYWRQPNVKHAEAVASFLSLPSHEERLSCMTNDEKGPKCGPPKRAASHRAQATCQGAWGCGMTLTGPFAIRPLGTLQFAGIPNKGFLVPLSNLYKLLISGGVLPTPTSHFHRRPATQSLVSVIHHGIRTD